MKSTAVKKVLSIILTLSMFAGLFSITSCSENETSGNQNQTEKITETTESSSESGVSEETSEERIYPDIPDDLKFNGEEVRIAMHPIGGENWQDWLSRDIDAEEYNGEIINDAVYSRNLAVEEKLNVKITGIETTDMANKVKQQVMAGTDDFHISTERIAGLDNIVRTGCYVNFYDLPYVDLEKPWYDQNMVDACTILNQLYFVTGDLLILDDDSTAAMVFNKDLVRDYNLESPYGLVSNNQWIFDKMNEMVTGAAKDLNGDGKMDVDDQYGLMWQRDGVVSFFHAAGGRITQNNSEGIPEFSIENEQSINVFNKIFEIMYRDDIVINLHHYEGKQDIYQLQTKMFKENRVLLMWIRMRVVETLRDMETDFGIIPMPKYTSEQPDYYHTVSRYTSAAIGVPNSAAVNFDLVGAVLESLSAESRYTLREAYYDKNLGTKLARDPESTDMLDIIMNSRVYDTGDIYNIGNLTWDLVFMSQTNDSNITSFLKKRSKAANKQLEKFINDFEKMAE